MAQKTNIDFLTHIMEFSKNGAVMQLFVMDAVCKQAERVIEQQDKIREAMQNHLITPNAWINTAKEFIEEYNKNYKG